MVPASTVAPWRGRRCRVAHRRRPDLHLDERQRQPRAGARTFSDPGGSATRSAAPRRRDPAPRHASTCARDRPPGSSGSPGSAAAGIPACTAQGEPGACGATAGRPRPVHLLSAADDDERTDHDDEYIRDKYVTDIH